MTFMRWIGRGFLALLVLAAITYPLADWLRTPLDDATRSALISAGEAQRFENLSAGITHVRVEGPANGPTIVLIHGFSAAGFIFDD